MNSIPVLVGLSLAVGVGLIVNAIATTTLDFGRRIYGWMGRRRGRLAILGLSNSRQQRDGFIRDDVSSLAAIPWTNLYAILGSRRCCCKNAKCYATNGGI